MIFLSEGLARADIRLSLRLVEPRPRLEVDGRGLRAVLDPVHFELEGVERWLAEAGLEVVQQVRRSGRVEIRAARAS